MYVFYVKMHFALLKLGKQSCQQNTTPHIYVGLLVENRVERSDYEYSWITYTYSFGGVDDKDGMHLLYSMYFIFCIDVLKI